MFPKNASTNEKHLSASLPLWLQKLFAARWALFIIAALVVGQVAIVMAFRQQHVKVLVHESRKLLNERFANGAERIAEKAVGLNPTDGYTWFYYGTALYMQRRFPEAIKAFENGMPFLPHSYNALRLLAFSNYNLANYPKTATGLADYLTMIPLPPVAPEMVFRMAGLSFLRLGELATANHYLLHSTQLSEEKGDLLRVRATISLLCNQPWSADYFFRTFRFYLPNQEFNPYEIVANAVEANKLAVAITFLESIQSRNPEDSSIVKALAGAYKTTGKITKAGELLKAAIERTPENPEYRLMYGDILFSQRLPAQAFEQYDAHLQLNPDSQFRRAILQKKATSRY